MPVLISPEVYGGATSTGHAFFHQMKRTDLDNGDYDTDVGLNDRAGLNVIFHRVQISHDPFKAGTCEGNIRLAISVDENCAYKDQFLSSVRAEGIEITEERREVWLDTSLHSIVVTGQQNILRFNAIARDAFIETAHEGAAIRRKFISNVLLGEAMDHINATVAKSQQPRESLGKQWAEMWPTYDWQP